MSPASAESRHNVAAMRAYARSDGAGVTTSVRPTCLASRFRRTLRRGRGRALEEDAPGAWRCQQPDLRRRPRALPGAGGPRRGGPMITLDGWMAKRMGLCEPLTRPELRAWQAARLERCRCLRAHELSFLSRARPIGQTSNSLARRYLRPSLHDGRGSCPQRSAVARAPAERGSARRHARHLGRLGPAQVRPLLGGGPKRRPSTFSSMAWAC